MVPALTKLPDCWSVLFWSKAAKDVIQRGMASPRGANSSQAGQTGTPECHCSAICIFISHMSFCQSLLCKVTLVPLERDSTTCPFGQRGLATQKIAWSMVLSGQCFHRSWQHGKLEYLKLQFQCMHPAQPGQCPIELRLRKHDGP